MTPDDIIKLLDATCICGARKLHDPIQHAFAADLMSDVLRLNTHRLLPEYGRIAVDNGNGQSTSHSYGRNGGYSVYSFCS